MKDGQILDVTDFDIKQLIPGYQDSDPERMYVFVPLHTQSKIVGYIVFCDCFKQIETRDLREYYNSFNQAFEKFMQNEYLQYMNDRLVEVAQIDSLTHVKNRSAYDNKESQLMKKLLGGTLQQFGLIMFDINNLKQINDVFGHNAGDEYILNSCKLICRIFKHSPIYRMGGDEFLVILENSDYDQKDELLKQFRKELDDIKENWDDLAPVDRISIASGIAVFTPETDSSVEDVYRRADALMYINKKEMKSDQSHK
jgi:diguanylate cyclase (GGDEF)-like protein